MSKKIFREALFLMESKDAADYIDRCTKVKLRAHDKAIITTVWLKKTGLAIKDLEYARSRHPKWKALKGKNHKERNKQRQEKYYFGKFNFQKWTVEQLDEFLILNEQKVDRELAEYYNRSIPAIQSLRRRINMVKKIDANLGRTSFSRKIFYKGETAIFNLYKKLEKNEATESDLVYINKEFS